MAERVTLFVRPDDPGSASAEAWLRDRGVEHSVVDVTKDPSASAVLFGRLGRVVTPAFQIGDKLVVGFDPVQLARLMPRDAEPADAVVFGAAVRTVTPEVAAAAGVPGVFGVEVGPVREGSAAAVAGIEAGDVIGEIAGFSLYGGPDQFAAAVAARRPGDSMRLRVWSGGTSRDIDVQFPILAPAAEPDSDS